ncbi:uncharacterized protein BX663DRAFT_493043 [Cokeromyces recurvatus]|uniref:uncharacterized protein n=1 Tax=Cokeromyces recurvatus TaxID=90255 RepID=UPI00221EB053|nr:uncharacterized protein BX663DRAFT_493043 [Cokeromyces recurvatus]KAI7908118.1 hypothetical protein BX663DRAFT_493043 [Cokeromyces recurvatus]
MHSNYDYEIHNDSDIDDHSEKDSLPKAWSDLIDPEYKLKSDGIGSGNLHRKGRNYKPVSEDIILNHRQHNAPIRRSRVAIKEHKRLIKPSSNAYISSTINTRDTHIRSSINLENEFSNSRWGAQPLTSTPFWEENKQTNEKKDTMINSNSKEESSSTVFNPLYHHNNIWKPLSREENPNLNFDKNQSSSERNVTKPIRGLLNTLAIHKHLNLPTTTLNLQKKSPYYCTNQDNNTMSLNPKPPEIVRRDQTNNDINVLSDYLGNSLEPSTDHDHFPAPFLKINIEFAPGLSSMLLVYRDSNAKDLVDTFIQKHRLELSNTAKNNIIKSIHFLIEKRRIELIP